MTKAEQHPKVGLLLIASPRFRNLGEGTARGKYHERKQADAQRIVDVLGRELDVYFPGLVYEREDLHRAILGFQTEGVDFVLAEFMSWSEDAQWIGFLRDMPPIPILFAHTVRPEVGFANTEDEDDFIEFLRIGGLVGSLEASGSIPRIGGRYVLPVVGSSEKIAQEAVRFGRAAQARRILRNAEIGLVGSYNEVMWSTYVDPYNIFTKLGPTQHFIAFSDLVGEIEQVPDADVAAYMAQLRAQYVVLPDVEEVKFAASARASLALARIAARLNLKIMVLNDVDHALFRAIGLRPGFYPSWFNEHGAVLVPEGDVGGGLATYLLKLFSGKYVSYIEPFHIDAKEGTFVGGHAGPNDHNDPAAVGRVKIARDVRFAKTSYKHAGAPFAWYRFTPGEKTMVHVSENNGRFKMICGIVDSIEGEHIITSYSHGVFRPRVPVEKYFEQILRIGSTQHFAIADGNWRESLRDFSTMAGIDFYDVG